MNNPTLTDRITARIQLAHNSTRACTNCNGSGQQPSWEHGPDFVDQCTRCDGLGIEGE